MERTVILVLAFFSGDVLSQSCRTPQGASSRCVNLYDCSEFVTAIRSYNPLPQHIATFMAQSKCGFEGNVPTVCCGPLPSQNSNNNDNNPSPGRRIQNNVEVEPASGEDSSPAPSNSCGLDSSDRIFGGENTDLDEFPWMALLGYLTRQNRLTYQCGGALINHRYVLTAAHCIIGQIEQKVGRLSSIRLGEHNTQSDPDCDSTGCAPAVQEIPVQLAVPNPGYEDKTKSNRDDIGLVRLARRVQYSYYVKPICLVQPSRQFDVGDAVFVAGWGTTLEGRGSAIKQKVQVPIFDKQECASKYARLGASLTNKQLCAGGEFSKDSCKGDSGGPLMRKQNNGIWETIAVVSFGYGCGRDGWPGVYTDVAAYLDWIGNTMRSTNV